MASEHDILNAESLKVADEERIKKTIGSPLTIAMDYSDGNLVYIGYAKAGTSKSEASWMIKKFTYSGDNITDIQFAEGNTNFDKVWNDRASYSYS